MPFGVDDAIMALGALPALGGLFGRKRDPVQEYLNQQGRLMAEQQAQDDAFRKRSIYSQAGTTGDAIQRMLGRFKMLQPYGSTNASPYVGAQAQAISQIADLGQNLNQQSLDQTSNAMRYLTGLRIGQAQNDQAYNRQQRQQGIGGFASLIGQIAQQAMAGAGGDKGRKVGSVLNGTQNGAPPGLDMNTAIYPKTLPQFSTYADYYAPAG